MTNWPAESIPRATRNETTIDNRGWSTESVPWASRDETIIDNRGWPAESIRRLDGTKRAEARWEKPLLTRFNAFRLR